MNAATPAPKAAATQVEKDASMQKQKARMAAHYDRLTSAAETGAKVCSTFVPGNLNELIGCFDLLNKLPEVNAIQSGLRRVSGQYVMEAEKIGHSEDVCTYDKSDIGMMAKGNIAPNGRKFPNPDVLLLSYTGCFTFMKWFELLREQFKCETIMLSRNALHGDVSRHPLNSTRTVSSESVCSVTSSSPRTFKSRLVASAAQAGLSIRSSMCESRA